MNVFSTELKFINIFYTNFNEISQKYLRKTLKVIAIIFMGFIK